MRDRLLDVRRLRRVRDAERVLGPRLMAVLRDPDRHGLAMEPLLEAVVEPRKRRERDVRPLHDLASDGEFGLNGYGWCDQASNLRRGFAFATSSANLPGVVRRAQPVGLVAAARRRLADRDEGARVARLDPAVGRRGKLRVVRRGDGAALRVELRATGRAGGSARSRPTRTARTGSRRSGPSSATRWRERSS